MNVNVFSQISPFIGKYINQNNTRHLSWIQQFGSRLQSEIVTPLGAAVPQLLSTAITQYQTASNREDECYLIITKSELTEQIAALDSERDTKYVGMKSMADALSRIGTAEQKQYALQLIDLIAHYKVDISERYDDETTKMSQLLQELQAEPWTSRITTLGLTDTVAGLLSINQQMKALIEQRNNELATITPQAMLQARQASDEAYQLVVAIINALAITQWNNGASPYDTAIARINQDQDYYVKNVFAQSSGGSGSSQGGSGNGGNETNEPNGQDGQNGQDEPGGSGDQGGSGDSGGSGDNGGGDNGGGGGQTSDGSDQ